MINKNFYKTIPADLMELVGKGAAEASLDPLLYGYQILFDKFNIPKTGVMHLGGHIGQELSMYAALGLGNVVMVEPLPDEFFLMQSKINDFNQTFTSLSAFLGDEIPRKAHGVNCAISDQSGVVKIYRTDITSLSSLAKPVKSGLSDSWDALVYDELSVSCKTLDQLVEELPNGWNAADFSYLRMNVQGFELKALKGAEQFLESISLIDLEINTELRYEESPTQEDFDNFLIQRGFIPILGYSAGPSIANVLYIRK